MKTRLLLRILVVFSLVQSCSTVPITGRKQLALIPQQQLLTLSTDTYQQLIAESKVSKDPEIVNMVTTVGRRIAASAEEFLRDNNRGGELEQYKWEFTVIDDSGTANAFCMPGGKIGVFTGILPITADDTGLAVVMGHEVAHAIANHGNERMSQLLVTQLGGMALSLALKEKPEQTQQLALAAYGLGANIGVLLPYSRSHESEADRIGLIIMARAGYDPHKAVPFWERMNEAAGARPPEFLSTHPAPERRIKSINKEIPEAMKYYRK